MAVIVTVPRIYGVDGLIFLDPLLTPPTDDPGPNEKTTVVVQGYFLPGDGGGGTFIFRRKTNNYLDPTDDQGIFINPNSSTLQQRGIWVRCFSGYIDLRFYGVNDADQSSNTTTKLQAAIDYAARSINDVSIRPAGFNNSNTVFIPNGEHYISAIAIKNGVRLIGASMKNTKLISINDSNPYLIYTPPGLHRDIQIENLTLIGNKAQAVWNPATKSITSFKKGCLGFIAQKDATGGGLWDSYFKNLLIMQFMGDSIRFVGGTLEGDHATPNQFNTFENVQVESVGELNALYPEFYNNSHALILLGSNGQFSFTNCRFDGGSFLFRKDTDQPLYNVTGVNVYIGSEVISNPINRLNIPHPAVINFNTCTIQVGEILVLIESCNNIKFDGCWFEDSERAIIAKGRFSSSKAINILNSSFLNCAGRYGTFVPNSGRIIVGQNAQINAHNNYVVDPGQSEQTRFMAVDNEIVNGVEVMAKDLGLNGSGNYFEPIGIGLSYLGYTEGIKKNITDFTANTINIDSAKSVYLVNPLTTAKIVHTILSQSIAGEYLFIRADQGTINLTEAGNLYLGNRTVVLKNGDTALFIKIDEKKSTSPYYDTYNLIAFLPKL